VESRHITNYQCPPDFSVPLIVDRVNSIEKSLNFPDFKSSPNIWWNSVRNAERLSLYAIEWLAGSAR